MKGVYPEATDGDDHLTIDVTLMELDAFCNWAEPQWRNMKDGPVRSFIELMLDCRSNYEILGNREFRLTLPGEDRHAAGRPDGPVILEDYLGD